MSTLPNTRHTLQEYLERESRAESRNEYYRGEIFAMAGASVEHHEIVGQLSTLLGPHVRVRGCRLYPADQRIATPGGLYTYPDLAVLCGTPQRSADDPNSLVNPVLLVEVLSPATENYDRGNKAKLYREIPSLQQLLLVSQENYEIELSTRQVDGSWSLQTFVGLDAVVELSSVGFTLRLREVYERIVPSGESASAH